MVSEKTAIPEKKQKLFCMRDLISLSGLHRRKIMYRVEMLAIRSVKRDPDGTRWFSEAQVQEILNYSSRRVG